MAFPLQFDKIQAVRFGEIEATPRITQERRLRLASLKLAESNREEICQNLSACFDNKAEVIREFMTNNMSITDLARLQAYILGGPSGLADLDDKTEKLVQRQVDEAYEKLKSNKVDANV